jgi:hypothetical protein
MFSLLSRLSSSLDSHLILTSTNGKFRNIKGQTIKKYRRPAIAALALLVRFSDANQSNDAVDSEFGNFRPLAARNQLKAGHDLRQLFLASKGSPDKKALMSLLHAAFDALLRPSDHLPEVPVACPTDQALLLIALVDQGRHFISARALQSECVALQWCFRAILIQVARLKHAGLTRYMPDKEVLTTSSPLPFAGSDDKYDSGRCDKQARAIPDNDSEGDNSDIPMTVDSDLMITSDEDIVDRISDSDFEGEELPGQPALKTGQLMTFKDDSLCLTGW